MNTNSISNHRTHTIIFIIGAMILLVNSWSQLVKVSGTIIADSFHQGEFFASFTSIIHSPETSPILIIHGALDYIPAWLSFAIYGQQNYFFGTLLLYNIANILSAFFLYLLVAIFIEKSDVNYKIMALVITAIVAPWSVSYKDLLLTLSLLLYFYRQRELQYLTSLFIEIGLGIAVSLNMFWSFDRGIAGMFSIGSACLIMAYWNRLYLNSLVAFFIMVTVLNYSLDIFSLQIYVENIKFLLNTSSQWSYGWQLKPVILSAALLFFCFSALVILLKSQINRKIFLDQSIANTVLLCLLTVIFIKIGTNRADIGHIYAAIWPAVLSVLYAHNAREHLVIIPELAAPQEHKPLYCRKTLFSLTRLNIFFVIIFILFTTFYLVENSRKLIKSLIYPPANEQMVSDSIQWVSNKLKSAGVNCVFDLANHGTINGLIAAPPCTRFAYLVYANKSYESEIIDSLINKKPPVVIYYSTNFSFNFDNNNMYQKFPKLKTYLEREYPYEICKYEYCIRYSTKNSSLHTDER